MPRKPSQSRSRHLVGSVVTAAEELLNDQSPLSISDLARRAGVGASSIYDYFKNKTGVLDAVVDRLTVHNFEILAKDLDARWDLPVADLVDYFAERVVGIYLDPGRSRMMGRVVSLIARRGDLEIHIEYRDRMATRLASRLRETLPTITVAESERCLEGICDIAMGLVMAELVRGDFDPDQTIALIRRVGHNEIGLLEQLHAARTAGSQS